VSIALSRRLVTQVPQQFPNLESPGNLPLPPAFCAVGLIAGNAGE
jgi:hypothetical protein